jgi:predicted dehydrogenase
MAIKLGILGAGAFAQCFIPLYKAHPQVSSVTLCDRNAEKLKASAEKYGITNCTTSYDELLKSDIDAVVIITQHWLHAPQAVQALKAGKHVYSAVPSAVSMDEITQLVETVTKQRRVYMIGETSYYYPEAIYCRERYKAGHFGHVVYGEAEYYHDWEHGLYDVMKWRHGENWRRLSGDPPMYYPTHSVGMLVSVTGAHATHVSAQGFVDRKPEDRDIYHPENSWGNLFSNEMALLKMSDGSSFRINEFRRIGHPGTVRMTLFGTEASFECNTAGSAWLTRDHKATIRLEEMLRCGERPASEFVDSKMSVVTATDGTHKDVSRVHPVARLPREFRGLGNGHNGSHQFLVDDFVRACDTETLPPNNIWQAARYLVPGLIAHESAKKGGELLKVPDFGDEPANWEKLK